MSDYREKRHHFRVDMLNNVEATAKILSINDRRVGVEKTFSVKILDLSSSGMRIFMTLDIPINVIIVNIKFDFEEEYFNLKAQLIWKAAKNDGFEYGLKFNFSVSREESRVTRCVNQYKIKHTRFKKIELDLREQKYLGCFVKMLEVIEEPAYLITSQRLVVAMNKAAHEMGMKLGERCYSTVCKSWKACSHCRLEEALEADRIVESEAMIKEKKYMACWLYLEDGLTIHYYREQSDV